MKTNFLFPYRLKTLSGILFSISFILLALFYSVSEFSNFEIKAKVFALFGDTGLFGENESFFWIENSITDELLILLVIPFGIIFAFSKEKHEDEMVSAIRLNSLAWATIINYVIILLGYLFVYGMPFLNVLMVAMISQLLIFILLFRFRMYRFYKTAAHEE
ncbi:hypothetical protein DVK85_05675 [Flavobacterium arcticum]|uniref:Uncharacterized protein n=1 Tax=Flavobacterium arcticum TaxID=1784713 RepID=A0A345HAZ0_9FLAO|nr:hypothetical protein [Flavobacterium arcticum]AXG73750.1 hypothetical protein DVK85_05675 [Flavobacterium arcticum]KAF2511701.1 hypothetical protein E0W72_05185 [Flavobacterium arcticum]